MEIKHLSRLSGVEKAAIFLLCLGEEAAAKVFEELDDNEVRKISRCMMGMDHVPADIAKQVIELFEKAQKDHAGLFVRGEEFVKKAISSGENQSRREMLMEQLAAGVSFRPLETIALMEARMVSGILEREHPQTVALVLSTQTPEHTSKIIEGFPEEFRAEVMYRMARIEKVSPEVIIQIEESLRREIGVVVSREHQQVGGIDKVVDILGRMPKGKDRAILSAMEETDPDMAEAIRRKLFAFDDLVHIDSRGLQAVLREINNDTLVLALKSASKALKTKIFENISQRAADMIQEDLEAMGPVRVADVEAAQQEIIQVALGLEEEGRLVIPGRGVTDVIV
ncbi:flagellar motor switch protein FliG [Desulfuromonas versatilis]|uniref:Flagellar motor switch protein FliG n=1 Tax=Desulfuromonas versatilis TaxID=2802975 RepID=A0ABM8HUN9_9BACT|nr:flagellar motor switch protein FliG [Desulfuromonas versatilis]BCR06637.1 flagellar motor switch protein FliG [Desulfuromonas versatilis]